MITRGSTRSRSCAMTSMQRWMSCSAKGAQFRDAIEERE